MTKSKSKKGSMGSQQKVKTGSKDLQITTLKRELRENMNKYEVQSAPAATRRTLPKIGMGDLLGHRISWIAGYIWVGDGSLGVIDQVYFAPAAPAGGTPNIVVGFGSTLSAPGQACVVPIAGGDAQVGALYVADVEKHYARKVVRDTKVRLHSVNPSTSNGMEVLIAPVRAASQVIDSVVSTANVLGNVYNNVVSMAGCLSAASWQDVVLNLKDFIAGGSGSNQNEFYIGNPSVRTGNSIVGTSTDPTQTIPACFAVSGRNSSTSMRGTSSHAVIIEQTVDLLDWIGGSSETNPISSPRCDIFSMLERRRNLLRSLERFSAATASVGDAKDVKSDRPSVSVPPLSQTATAAAKSAVVTTAPASDPRCSALASPYRGYMLVNTTDG